MPKEIIDPNINERVNKLIGIVTQIIRTGNREVSLSEILKYITIIIVYYYH